MKWSKLKSLVEATFAESVRGRVHLHTTAYQCSCGRAWITIDGKEIVDFSTLLSLNVHHVFYHESTDTDCLKHPAIPDSKREPGHLAEPGEFSRFDFHKACWRYLNEISLNDAVSSDNPLISSLAVLHKKVGKNRLERLSSLKLHPLTRALLEFRRKAEEAPKATASVNGVI